MRRRIVALAAVLVLAAACSSGDGDAKTSSGGPSPGRLWHGGTLRLASTSDITGVIGLGGENVADAGFDPQRSYSSVGWEFLRCCLARTLFAYSGQPGREGGGEARPDLASSWEVSADGLTWTIRIREGLRYAPPLEDIEITARDFVRALLRAARAGEGYIAPTFYYSVIRGYDEYAAGDAETIAGLETPDDHTLVVRLFRQTGDLLDRFALSPTAPIPPDPYRPAAVLGIAEGHDEDFGRFLVSTGPYMIEGSAELDLSVAPRRQEPMPGYQPPTVDRFNNLAGPGSLTLVRNPSWDPATDDLRPAYVDRIEVQIGMADAPKDFDRQLEELAAQVDAGELDHVVDADPPAEQLARYQADPELQRRLSVEARNSLWFITMNVAVPPFDDINVRRAVAYAIDEEELVARLLASRSWLAGSIASAPITHVVPDGMEQDLLAGYDPYEASLDLAKAAMAASRYDHQGADGVCDADACRGVLALSLKGPIPKSVNDLVADSLAAIGVELRVEHLQYSEWDPWLFDETRGVPMSIGLGWGADYLNPSSFFVPLFSSEAILGSGSNPTMVGASPSQLESWRYSVTEVPSVDDRINRCMATPGSDQLECWIGLDRYLMEEVVPSIPFMQTRAAAVVSQRVASFSYDQFAAVLALDRMALVPGSE